MRGEKRGKETICVCERKKRRKKAIKRDIYISWCKLWWEKKKV